jgi:fermentation-respiration switch protein FrsA (DUF1100 family)
MLPAVAVLVLIGLHYLAQAALYHPSKYPTGFWDVQAQLNAQDVWLRTRDGVRIHAWFVECPGSRLVTLFFHGNAGNVTHRYPHFQEIAAAGSSLLMIDYRGYGKSAGAPSEAGLYKDADAAFDWLLANHYTPAQIVIHGESLGSAVAVDLASRRACAGLVLEAPFTSAGEVAGTILPVVGPLVMRDFDSRSKIGRVHAPLLLIHGDRDEVIPYRLGQALFAAAPEPKTFWTVPGSGHNDILETAGPLYRVRLHAFYATLAALPQ